MHINVLFLLDWLFTYEMDIQREILSKDFSSDSPWHIKDFISDSPWHIKDFISDSPWHTSIQKDFKLLTSLRCFSLG